jgi:hypothetical protein
LQPVDTGAETTEVPHELQPVETIAEPQELQPVDTGAA